MHRGSFYERSSAVLSSLGLNIKLHGGRHTYVSQLLGAGVPLTAVAKVAGHSNVQVTARTYAHAMPNHLDEIRSRTADLYATTS